MDEFPSNAKSSKAPKPEKPEKQRLEKIIEGEVNLRKKPLSKKFKEFFFGRDSKTVGEYIIHDVIIPGFKDIVYDASTGGLSRKLYGEVRPNHRRGGGPQSGGRFDYSGVSSRSRPAFREEPRNSISRRGRATHDFDELLFRDRFEAQDVLDALYHTLEKYEVVSVNDLYDAVGITSDYAAERWGWYDLGGAGISHTRAGYLLDLPRPEPIS